MLAVYRTIANEDGMAELFNHPQALSLAIIAMPKAETGNTRCSNKVLSRTIPTLENQRILLELVRERRGASSSQEATKARITRKKTSRTATSFLIRYPE